MNSQSHQRYEFGPFQVDIAEHSLLRDGKPVSLTPKVFDLLRVLVQNNGRLVEKDELLKEVWPDSFVEEGNLNRNVSILRKVLGEDATGKPYIETVPKRGYRFVANVKGRTETALGQSIPSRLTRILKSTISTLQRASLKASPEKRRTHSLRRWLVLGGVVALGVGIVAYLLVQRQGNGAKGPKSNP